MTPTRSKRANAVAKMAALGTYLANLRDDAVRVRYTELSMAVEKVVERGTADAACRARQAVRAGRPDIRRPERRLREVGAGKPM